MKKYTNDNTLIFKIPDIKKKNYNEPTNCLPIEDGCSILIDLILDKCDSSFCECVWEVADDLTHIYDEELWKTLSTTGIGEYVARAIKEYDINPENNDGYRYILKAIQGGENLYYYEQLHRNATAIVQNALIERLQNECVECNIDCNPDDIINFIESYIENIIVDTDDSLDSFIENFESELFNKFNASLTYIPETLLKKGA